MRLPAGAAHRVPSTRDGRERSTSREATYFAILTTDDADAAAPFARIPGIESVTQEEGRFTLEGKGDAFVTDVIQCLSESRIHVRDFRTVLPSLEDVFLKLTGHSLRD